MLKKDKNKQLEGYIKCFERIKGLDPNSKTKLLSICRVNSNILESKTITPEVKKFINSITRRVYNHSKTKYVDTSYPSASTGYKFPDKKGILLYINSKKIKKSKDVIYAECFTTLKRLTQQEKENLLQYNDCDISLLNLNIPNKKIRNVMDKVAAWVQLAKRKEYKVWLESGDRIWWVDNGDYLKKCPPPTEQGFKEYIRHVVMKKQNNKTYMRQCLEELKKLNDDEKQDLSNRFGINIDLICSGNNPDDFVSMRKTVCGWIMAQKKRKNSTWHTHVQTGNPWLIRQENGGSTCFPTMYGFSDYVTYSINEKKENDYKKNFQTCYLIIKKLDNNIQQSLLAYFNLKDSVLQNKKVSEDVVSLIKTVSLWAYTQITNKRGAWREHEKNNSPSWSVPTEVNCKYPFPSAECFRVYVEEVCNGEYQLRKAPKKGKKNKKRSKKSDIKKCRKVKIIEKKGNE
ncbi:MAG: hypothetical protein PVI75_04710 [Gammaproteobacteria bacterium]|jgi:hypothetical protein